MIARTSGDWYRISPPGADPVEWIRSSEVMTSKQLKDKRAEDGFREFLVDFTKDTKPRPYQKAISNVVADGSNISIHLDIRDEEQASMLCGFTLQGFVALYGEEYGVTNVRIVDAKRPSSVLAKSVPIANGMKTCKKASDL